jgi:hypothetical protein
MEDSAFGGNGEQNTHIYFPLNSETIFEDILALIAKE